MSHFAIRSPAEQVADHLRGELMRGVWSKEMPGTPMLAERMGLDRKTITAALAFLEEEGLLVSQGHGRRRRIELPEEIPTAALRFAILDYDEPSKSAEYMVDLRYQLGEVGHSPFFSSKTLLELKMDVRRVAKMVEQTEADAWLVCGGSREVLEWFAEQSLPAFAFVGRLREVALASIGPDKLPAMLTMVRRFVELGHRRIVLLEREERRKPKPGYPERMIMAELEALGIPTGPYNLPDWEDSKEGLYRLLDSLFQHTPPTAMFIDEPHLFSATHQYLARRGIHAPEHVSLVCADPDPTFTWHQPSVAHIRWDSRPIVRRIVRWANNVARGRDDRRKTFSKAEFVEGGTMGPRTR